MTEFTDKKILILGANPETIPLILTAKRMGATVVVTDYDPEAPAKKHADIRYDVDAMNVDALYELAKKEQVDGVMVGVADVLISPYQKLCQRLNLPCYANEKSVWAFNQKRNFKNTCAEYGIPGTPEYFLPEDRNKIEYPVIVKPADSNSGKGITLCYNDGELDEAVELARQSSRSDTYLIERFMTCRDVSIYYTLRDGEVYLSTVSDRFTTRSQAGVSQVCIGDVFPSTLLDEFIEKEHPKYCEMFKGLGVKNGVFYVQAFYEDGNYYVYDPGFRLQGGGYHFIVAGASGVDQCEMLVRFSLTGDMGGGDITSKLDPYLGGKAAGVVWFLLKEGKIAEIKGDNFIKNHPDVVRIVERFSVDDEITPKMIGTEHQVYMRVFLVCNNKDTLCKTVTEMQKSLNVIDTQGRDMVIPGIDMSKL